MCLLTNDKKVLTAEKDLTFYKVVKLDKNGKYFSLFMYDRITIGKLKKQKYINGFRFIQNAYNVFDYRIEAGGYHLFTNLNFAKEYADGESWGGVRRTKVIKAIVPKGTKYVKGVYNTCFHGNVESVVAKMVIYEELEN